MAEYRIVRDGYAGYEVQKRTWWLPIWRQAGFCNTHRSIDAAREYAKVDAGQVVERLGHLRPNAEVSCAGTASAGLPGYAAGGNGERK